MASATLSTSEQGDYRLPAGPRTPRLLNGIVFLLARNALMRALQRRYGDAYTIEMPGFGHMVVVATPELVKQVFTAKPEVLHGGKNPLGEVLGPGSLFSMDEERHLQERRMLLAPFHGERMRSYEPLIEEEALRALAAWPQGERFATIRTFNTITLRVILRAVFGAEGEELAALQRLLPPLTAVGQRIVTAPALRRDLGPRSPGRRFRQMMVRYRQLVEALIDHHLADPRLDERIDILAQVLRAQGEGELPSRSELGDELLTLLVAGHETTASSLAWSVERLSRHPQLLRRLEEEAAGEESTLRLATINEVLRVRPVINATGRYAMQPFELGQWRLPAGTVILAGIAPLHRDGRFHGQALRFDPDRYVARKPDTYSWIPFGGGMRRCLGAAFAQFEMDIVLRTMLRGFEILPCTDPPERESFRGVAFAPSRGGMARVRRRQVPLGGRPQRAEDRAACPVAHAGA